MTQRHYVFLCMYITLFAEQNLIRSQRIFVTIFLKFHIRSSRHGAYTYIRMFSTTVEGEARCLKGCGFQNFNKCRKTIASALNDYCTRWCKREREHVESNALNNWKLKIFKIIDERVLFYSNNLDLLPPQPKLSFRYLKQGIQGFHRKYVLAPADKAANNVVVV